MFKCMRIKNFMFYYLIGVFLFFVYQKKIISLKKYYSCLEFKNKNFLYEYLPEINTVINEKINVVLKKKLEAHGNSEKINFDNFVTFNNQGNRKKGNIKMTAYLSPFSITVNSRLIS